MLNVVIAKMGRSIYFNRANWKAGAGNNEAPLLFSAIAKLNPNNTYYLIGKSDLSRVSEEIKAEWFPHGNVVDVWDGWNILRPDPTTYIWNKLKDVSIDYGIVHGGMVSLSIPNKIYCIDRKNKGQITDKLRSPLASLVNYVSPITYYLNESKIDWLTITSDGRYMPMEARDLINVEKISLGVREGTATVNRMKSYEEQTTMVEHKVDLRYASAEFQYLLDNKWNKFRQHEKKTVKVGLFFHQYDDKKRITAIKEIVEAFNEDEVAVYGKWNEEGPKYKGSIPFDELQTLLPAVKYTFCYPITKGDISAKWVEAVTNGIIPFFHKTYDEDKLLTKYHKVPEWLWVEDVEDMKVKIQFLEDNPIQYARMKNMLISSISGFTTGAHFVNSINRAVNDMKKINKNG